jgi:glycosyltransferase involved in cell wall biosynthesis
VRILQVHNRYRTSSPGGEDRVVDQEFAALRKHGHTVERFERFNDDIEGFSAVRAVRVPFDVVWSDATRRDLKRTIERFRPDVVHVHNTFPLMSPSVLYACKATKTPVVVTLHNYRLACPSGELFRDDHSCRECVGHLPIPAVRHGCYRSSLESAPVALSSALHMRSWRTIPSAFIFISEGQRELMSPLRLPADRSFVKHNLVPTSIAPAATVETQPIVVYAGRTTSAKGVRLLMRAWDGYLAAGGSGLKLVMAGTGPLDNEIEAWSATRPSTEFLHMLSRDECAALVASARAVVVPSEWPETFGLVAIEAMACGVPPIAPAHGSFPTLIDSDEDGVLFDPGNAEALAKVLLDVDEDPERFATIGQNARNTYGQRFDPDENVQQLLDIYEFAISALLQPQDR